MPIEEAAVAGRIALEVGESVAPKLAAEGVNLLTVAEKRVVASLPSEIKAMVHVGPNNGTIEIHHSIDAEIGKARMFEATSHTPYAKPLGSFPQLQETKKIDTLVIGGGMAGLSIADRLAANGIHTMLVDAGAIGEGTSQFAGGMITRAGDPSFVELGETYGEKTLARYARGMVKAHDGLLEESKDGMPIIARHAELPQVYGISGIGGSGIDSSQFVADELAKTLKVGNSVLSAERFAK
ncbi:MAG: FAD-dependent oxidoreductase [Cyanobacteria bacterium REEB67]|nr:FAD-dependent oxidoreductase [Cyanobacteria bacterium REEB67]